MFWAFGCGKWLCTGTYQSFLMPGYSKMHADSNRKPFVINPQNIQNLPEITKTV